MGSTEGREILGTRGILRLEIYRIDYRIDCHLASKRSLRDSKKFEEAGKRQRFWMILLVHIFKQVGSIISIKSADTDII